MVITAASCFFDEKTKKPLDMNDYSVVLGTNDPMNVTEGFERRLSRVMIHPKYKYPQVCIKIKLPCPVYLCVQNDFGPVSESKVQYCEVIFGPVQIDLEEFKIICICPKYFELAQNRFAPIEGQGKIVLSRKLWKLICNQFNILE